MTSDEPKPLQEPPPFTFTERPSQQPPGSLEELEARNAWSERGFLGSHESFRQVVSEDAASLAKLGFRHDEIADALSQVVALGLAPLAKALAAMETAREKGVDDWSAVSAEWERMNASFSVKRRHARPLRRGRQVDHLHVFMMQYQGSQECPWVCWAFGTRDYMILNRDAGDFVVAAELMSHLISHHYFFEGRGSPYRLEPARVVSVRTSAGVRRYAGARRDTVQQCLERGEEALRRGDPSFDGLYLAVLLLEDGVRRCSFETIDRAQRVRAACQGPNRDERWRAAVDAARQAIEARLAFGSVSSTT